MKQYPPRQIFEELVNKNAIKRKIGGPSLGIFPETLDPPRNFGKNIPYPLPWIFNPCASMTDIKRQTKRRKTLEYRRKQTDRKKKDSSNDREKG
jgi:hypothetical protein